MVQEREFVPAVTKTAIVAISTEPGCWYNRRVTRPVVPVSWPLYRHSRSRVSPTVQTESAFGLITRSVDADGWGVGNGEGRAVGDGDGRDVGLGLGIEVGRDVGSGDGRGIGRSVGGGDGTAVGTGVGGNDDETPKDVE